MNTVLVSIMGVNEASEAWGISKRTIKELSKCGKIVATPIDDTWAILRDQSEESLKLIENARKQENLYHIAATSPNDPIINFIKNAPLSLEQPIEMIFQHDSSPLSSRAVNSLKRAGIHTVKCLVESTFNKLQPIRNLGKSALIHTFHMLKQVADTPSP